MKVNALLPMKGHSERVPKKNLRNFAGRPLFHCIADVLEKSNLIESIIINTDSREIANNAKKNFSKVIIHERPEAIRGDMVPMNDIIADDLENSDNDIFIQTHCTNPLLTVNTIESAIKFYFDNLERHDSVFSVTKVQTRLYDELGKPVNHNPNELLRTQDLPPLFEENSNFYIFNRETFIAAGHKRIGLSPKMYVVDPLEAIDIDDETDFIIAELLYDMKKNTIES